MGVKSIAKKDVSLTVITSTFTAYHKFQQAAQLERHGLLDAIISNYPKFRVAKSGIPRRKIVSLLETGMLHFIQKKIPFLKHPAIRKRIICWLSDRFSKSLGAHLRDHHDVYIGLSAFSLEALVAAKERKICAVIDHGSLHLRTQMRTIANEYSKFKLDYEGIANWVLEKEEKEFAIADHILVPSEYAKSSFIENGVSADKVSVVQLGVSLQNFSPVTSRRARTNFVVVYAGGMTIAKGVHYLVKAFDEMNQPNSELWLIGAGWPNHDLALAIEKLGASLDKVKWLGPYPEAELQFLYHQADVFVFPSLADGFGLVVLQALATGLPCVVSSAAGSSEIISDDFNGYVVAPGDHHAIKEKLGDLYLRRECLSVMRENAISSVVDGFSWDDYGDRLVDCLYDIIID